MNDTYREVIRHDSFRAGFHHADQGHDHDLDGAYFDAPEDNEAWDAGWQEGHDHGPHRPGHYDQHAAEKAWRAWEAARKGVA